LALTGAALILLVIHHRFRIFRRLRVDHVLHAVLLTYLLLASYELMLVQPMRILTPTVSIRLLGVMLSIMGLYLERKHTARRDD
jgi:presenilin-like A22 family membrane protease